MLELSAALPEVTCARGTELIREGEVPGRLFVLVDGEFEVVRDDVKISVVDETLKNFGEMGVLLGSAATATVRALRDSRLRHSDDPHTFLETHPLAARAVATLLARRLDTISGYLVDLRHQYEDHGNLGMVDTVLETLRHHQVRSPRTDRSEAGSERQPDAPY